MSGRKYFGKATEVYYGAVAYARAFAGKPGVKITPELVLKEYGAIALAVANAVVASQDLTALGVFSGAGITGGSVTFVTPRNVVAAWTGAAVITVTGTDEYGSIVKESSASGTSLTGKKAFKTVTAVTVSADVTALTVGFGVVIGLPYRCDANQMIVKNMDGAITTATFVAAVTTDPATATTGDVRGTLTFGSAPDATRVYSVLFKVADPSSKTGAYGIKQFGSTDSA